MSVGLYIAQNFPTTLKATSRSRASATLLPNSEEIFPLDKSKQSWELCNNLRSYLNESTSVKENRKVWLALTKVAEKTDDKVNRRLKVCIYGPFVDHLQTVLGSSVTMRIKLYDFHSTESEICLTLNSIAMNARRIGDENMVIFEDILSTNNKEDYPFGYTWQQGSSYDARVTITASATINYPNKENERISEYQPPYSVLTSLTRKFLDEQIATDVTIVAENGTEFPCHKLFLSGSSTVFRTMLQGENFREAQTNKIVMDDMTEHGVEALLAYIYYVSVKQAQKDIHVAMELLQASEKYSMENLKKSMKGVFLGKPYDWYKTEGALQVFLFARNATDCVDLKNKAVSLLVSNPTTVSEEYKNVLSKNPDAAVELCTAFMEQRLGK